MYTVHVLAVWCYAEYACTVILDDIWWIFDELMNLELAAMSKLMSWIWRTRIAFGQSLLETGLLLPPPQVLLISPPPPSSSLLPAPCSGNWSPANCLKILEHMGLEAAPGPGVGRGSPGLRVNGPGKDGWVTEAGVRIGVGQYWSEVWGVQHPAYTAKR